MERFIHKQEIINFTQTWCKGKVFYGQPKRKIELNRTPLKTLEKDAAFPLFTFNQD